MGGEGEEGRDGRGRVGGGFELVGGSVIVVPGIWFVYLAIKKQKKGSADVTG